MPDLDPMLAGPGVPATVEGWVGEPKLDGWRARVLADPELPEGFAGRTRRGRTIDEEIASLLSWLGLTALRHGQRPPER